MGTEVEEQPPDMPEGVEAEVPPEEPAKEQEPEGEPEGEPEQEPAEAEAKVSMDTEAPTPTPLKDPDADRPQTIRLTCPGCSKEVQAPLREGFNRVRCSLCGLLFGAKVESTPVSAGAPKRKRSLGSEKTPASGDLADKAAKVQLPPEWTVEHRVAPNCTYNVFHGPNGESAQSYKQAWRIHNGEVSNPRQKRKSQGEGGAPASADGNEEADVEVEAEAEATVTAEAEAEVEAEPMVEAEATVETEAMVEAEAEVAPPEASVPPAEVEAAAE